MWLLLAILLQLPEQTSTDHNPIGIAFICPSHDKDDGHELDIFSRLDNKVIATLELGDPPINDAGEVIALVRVHPYNSGVYEFRVRSKIGTLKSKDSEAWIWQISSGNLNK